MHLNVTQAQVGTLPTNDWKKLGKFYDYGKYEIQPYLKHQNIYTTVKYTLTAVRS